MKRTFLLLAALACTGCSSTTTTTKAPDGEPQHELRIEEVRVEKEGNLVPVGTLLETKSYYLDASGQHVQHGPDIYFFDNGKKRLEANYRDGLMDGTVTEFSLYSDEKERE